MTKKEKIEELKGDLKTFANEWETIVEEDGILRTRHNFRAAIQELIDMGVLEEEFAKTFPDGTIIDEIDYAETKKHSFTLMMEQTIYFPDEFGAKFEIWYEQDPQDYYHIFVIFPGDHDKVSFKPVFYLGKADPFPTAVNLINEYINKYIENNL